jgi:Ser/Thr protein kinase RdoA (MazF antagonist)
LVDLAVVVAHQERVTLRVGDVYVKVDVEDGRIQREVDALAAATGVPRPEVRWQHEHVVALSEVVGVPLGVLGAPSPSTPAAWRNAGAMARELHSHPLPPWTAWDHRGFTEFIDGECRWLYDHGVAPTTTIDAVRRQVEPALRPFPVVFTHGDLQAAHVLVEDDDVRGIIDWADACQGDALFDLAILTVGHTEHLDDVLEGYGVEVDRDVVRGWWALRRLASLRWMLEHGFDASGDLACLEATAEGAW